MALIQDAQNGAALSSPETIRNKIMFWTIQLANATECDVQVGTNHGPYCATPTAQYFPQFKNSAAHEALTNLELLGANPPLHTR